MFRADLCYSAAIGRPRRTRVPGRIRTGGFDRPSLCDRTTGFRVSTWPGLAPSGSLRDRVRHSTTWAHLAVDVHVVRPRTRNSLVAHSTRRSCATYRSRRCEEMSLAARGKRLRMLWISVGLTSVPGQLGIASVIVRSSVVAVTSLAWSPMTLSRCLQRKTVTDVESQLQSGECNLDLRRQTGVHTFEFVPLPLHSPVAW